MKVIVTTLPTLLSSNLDKRAYVTSVKELLHLGYLWRVTPFLRSTLNLTLTLTVFLC